VAFPLSSEANGLIGRSHQIEIRAVFEHQLYGRQVAAVSGGSIFSDATSQVRNGGTLNIDPRLWPDGPNGLIAPFGAVAIVDYGIILSNGTTEWVRLGSMPVEQAQRKRPVTGDAAIPVKLSDFSAWIAEDTFDSPQQTVAGATAVAEITRLAQRTLPAVIVLDQSGALNRVIPTFEMQSNPWADGIEKLAAGITCEVFFDVYGRLVIRPIPTLADLPVWYARTGDDSNIVEINEELSRERVFNRVVATGQRTDSVPPVTGTAVNSDPASPTYYGGVFGRKTKRVVSPTLTTTAQANAMAAATLERVRGVSFDASLRTLVHPGLRASDVIQVSDPLLGTGPHILDRVEIPLSATDLLSLSTRSDNQAD
jgi:hypothetical protein